MDCAERDIGRTSSFSSILSIHPIYDGIYSRLSPGARIRFGRTCRLAYNSVQDFHSRAFNINHHLRRFFDDPIAFRNMQARLAMLISGSNALQFLDSTSYPGSDLDLYVWEDSAKEVGHWLMEHERYSFAPSIDQDKNFDVASETVFTWSDNLDQSLARNDCDDYYSTQPLEWYSFIQNGPDGPLKVQIVASARSPLVTILNFHSTCVMNCIAFDAAYSLYPQATFENKRSLCMASNASRVAEFAKYERRGWQPTVFVSRRKERDIKALFHPDDTRWVCDRHSGLQ
ncbi:hypothetical protein HETIRDRAFT_444789 [Heterobasidion irregulare TC 32-1]|uniref:Uncharacterized protein n=1 Tax=Heterobasidion irregulare (strain TC 32-1) TaxID=747525 RepID=W4K7Y5_HETIT|nr:uncharacterized protein HETIRDRAFT_444789 [Heterobasidion irregulare TC 32-1]ETW81465.1 hypothetical protein HETIRDRAFT_444789 [Heterobasidion irregulare TC 32-1]